MSVIDRLWTRNRKIVPLLNSLMPLESITVFFNSKKYSRENGMINKLLIATVFTMFNSLACANANSNDFEIKGELHEMFQADVVIKARNGCDILGFNSSKENLKVQLRCDGIAKIHSYKIDTVGKGVYFKNAGQEQDVIIVVYGVSGIDLSKLKGQLSKTEKPQG